MRPTQTQSPTRRAGPEEMHEKLKVLAARAAAARETARGLREMSETIDAFKKSP